MVAPGVDVRASAAAVPRGRPTSTATTFPFALAEDGPYDTPTLIRTLPAYEETFGGVETGALGHETVDALLRVGGGTVVFTRVGATGTANGAVAAADWVRASKAVPASRGPGQIIAPGQTDPAVQTELRAHAEGRNRFAILDAPVTDDAAALATFAATQVNASGSHVSMLVGTTLRVPGAAGPRDLPGSAIAAGVVANSDRGGLLNVQPIFTAGQGRAPYAVDVTHDFTDTQIDTLYDAGVNVFRVDDGGAPYLGGFRSLAVARPEFRQANWGRTLMGLTAELREDAFGILGGEPGRVRSTADLQRVVALLSPTLADYYNRGELFGDSPDDAFALIVNSDLGDLAEGRADIAAEVRLSPSLERVSIDVISVPLA